MYSGEQTLLMTRPTRLIAFRFYVTAIFFLILAAVSFFRVVQWFAPTFDLPDIAGWNLSTLLAIFFLFLALVAFLTAELKQKTTRYIVTDNKIIREDGILNKRTAMVPYTQLERVDLQQSLAQRILRIGSLVVDTGDDSITIDMVPHPKRIQELLSNRMGRRAFLGQSGQLPR